MILALRYWRLILPVVLFLVCFLGFNIYIADVKDKAAEAERERAEQQAKEQIAADIQVAKEAFETNPAINDIVDEILAKEQEKREGIIFDFVNTHSNIVQPNSDGDESRLQRIESSPTIPNKRDSQAGANVGNEYGLSIDEINQIREYSGLLQ